MPHPVGGDMGVTLCHCCEKGNTRFETVTCWYLHGCCTLTSTVDFLLAWQGTQPTVLQLFLRYSVEIYKYAHASERF